MRWFAKDFLALLMVALLAACGGGGGSSANGTADQTAASPSLTTTTNPGTTTTPNPGTTTPTNPGTTTTGTTDPAVIPPNSVVTTTQSFAPIQPIDMKAEVQPVAVNATYSALLSNAPQIVQSVSDFFAKTTDKRFAVGNLLTYSDFSSAISDASFYQDNGYVGSNYGGATIFFYLTPTEITSYMQLPPEFAHAGSTGFYSATTINGKTYGRICLAECVSESVLQGKDQLALLKYITGLTAWDDDISTIAHEEGHGLGLYDLYNLDFSDQSGLPDLSYDVAMDPVYKLDPMVEADVVDYGITEYKFSGPNSAIINKNLNHQKMWWEINQAVTNLRLLIRVRDAAGNLIVGAPVTVYGAVTASGTAVDLTQKLQTGQTDLNGLMDLTNDYFTAWQAKSIKVALSDGRVGGCNLSFPILIQSYHLLHVTDFYFVDIFVSAP